VLQAAGGSFPGLLPVISSPAASAMVPSWVFLGPPGVGKGTYSSRVADALGVPHISAGDLVRQEMKEGTEYGKKVGKRNP
jgi:adenylate kinase